MDLHERDDTERHTVESVPATKLAIFCALFSKTNFRICVSKACPCRWLAGASSMGRWDKRPKETFGESIKNTSPIRNRNMNQSMERRQRVYRLRNNQLSIKLIWDLNSGVVCRRFPTDGRRAIYRPRDQTELFMLAANITFFC